GRLATSSRAEGGRPGDDAVYWAERELQPVRAPGGGARAPEARAAPGALGARTARVDGRAVDPRHQARRVYVVQDGGRDAGGDPPSASCARNVMPRGP